MGPITQKDSITPFLCDKTPAEIHRYHFVLPPKACKFASEVIRFAEREISGRLPRKIQSIYPSNRQKELSYRISRLPFALQVELYNTIDRLDDWLIATGFFLSTPKNLDTIRAIVKSLEDHNERWELKFDEGLGNLKKTDLLIKQEKRVGKVALLHLERLYMPLHAFLMKISAKFVVETSREEEDALKPLLSRSFPVKNLVLKVEKWMFLHPRCGIVLMLSAIFVDIVFCIYISRALITLLTFLFTLSCHYVGFLPHLIPIFSSTPFSIWAFLFRFPFLHICLEKLRNSPAFCLNKDKPLIRLIDRMFASITFPTMMAEKILQFTRITPLRRASHLGAPYLFLSNIMVCNAFQSQPSPFTLQTAADWHVVSRIALDAMFKDVIREYS